MTYGSLWTHKVHFFAVISLHVSWITSLISCTSQPKYRGMETRTVLKRKSMLLNISVIKEHLCNDPLEMSVTGSLVCISYEATPLLP